MATDTGWKQDVFRHSADSCCHIQDPQFLAVLPLWDMNHNKPAVSLFASLCGQAEHFALMIQQKVSTDTVVARDGGTDDGTVHSLRFFLIFFFFFGGGGALFLYGMAPLIDASCSTCAGALPCYWRLYLLLFHLQKPACLWLVLPPSLPIPSTTTTPHPDQFEKVPNKAKAQHTPHSVARGQHTPRCGIRPY